MVSGRSEERSGLGGSAWKHVELPPTTKRSLTRLADADTHVAWVSLLANSQFREGECPLFGDGQASIKLKSLVLDGLNLFHASSQR